MLKTFRLLFNIAVIDASLSRRNEIPFSRVVK